MCSMFSITSGGFGNEGDVCEAKGWGLFGIDTLMQLSDRRQIGMKLLLLSVQKCCGGLKGEFCYKHQGDRASATVDN